MNTEIKKLLEFEACHVVRNCPTRKCSHNVHGHSYKINIGLSADILTNYGMVVDFSEVKRVLGKIVDDIDHSWHYWDTESDEFKQFIHANNERYVELNFSPTAENYSRWLAKLFNEKIIELEPGNPRRVYVSSVEIWETRTGSACTRFDSYVDMTDYVRECNKVNMFNSIIKI